MTVILHDNVSPHALGHAVLCPLGSSSSITFPRKPSLNPQLEAPHRSQFSTTKTQSDQVYTESPQQALQKWCRMSYYSPQIPITQQ